MDFDPFKPEQGATSPGVSILGHKFLWLAIDFLLKVFDSLFSALLHALSVHSTRRHVGVLARVRRIHVFTQGFAVVQSKFN